MEKSIAHEIAQKYLNMVCDQLKLPVTDVISKSRKRELCEARQVSSFVIRKYTSLSQADVAMLLNYKDHASVWRDETNVPELAQFNKFFAQKIRPVLLKAKKLHEDILTDELEMKFIEDEDVFDFYSEVAFEQPIKS